MIEGRQQVAERVADVDVERDLAAAKTDLEHAELAHAVGIAGIAPNEAQLKALLAPYPSDGMIAWPVSKRVGNVKNNDPTLVEPIDAG